ncbi:MAG: type II toxin-antitoxin system RatA family toxin [Magnetospirillum sp.]|nr:type II toxin-antitoxin system RatA family toxin [Magnetospirillum sp.]
MLPVTGRVAAEFPRFSAEQMFALAADVESYPQFIPWCRRASVLARHGDVLEVDNHFGAGPLDAGFRTRAVATPPHRLEITADGAPFRNFRLLWTFEPLPDGGCRVGAEYALSLRSPLLHGLARMAMPEASRKIIHRFQERAAALYA